MKKMFASPPQTTTHDGKPVMISMLASMEVPDPNNEYMIDYLLFGDVTPEKAAELLTPVLLKMKSIGFELVLCDNDTDLLTRCAKHRPGEYADKMLADRFSDIEVMA